MRGAIERYVREHAPVPPSAVEVPVPEGLEALWRERPDADLQLSTHERTRFVGTVPVQVALVADGEELERAVVTAQVSAEGSVWVAARSLPQGAPIHTDDLRQERRDLATLPPRRTLRSEEIVGQRTARAIAAGTPWQEGLVSQGVLVSRGDTVRLRLQHGGLRIQGVGRAREDGRPGDTIRLLNVDTRRELHGRVAEDGVVDVEF